MAQALIFFGLVVWASLPFASILDWSFTRSREVYSRLDRPDTGIYFSKAPLRFGFIQICQFLKGYLFFYVGYVFLESSTLLMIALILFMLFHRWSPLLGFREQSDL